MVPGIEMRDACVYELMGHEREGDGDAERWFCSIPSPPPPRVFSQSVQNNFPDSAIRYDALQDCDCDACEAKLHH